MSTDDVGAARNHKDNRTPVLKPKTLRLADQTAAVGRSFRSSAAAATDTSEANTLAPAVASGRRLHRVDSGPECLVS